MKPTLIKYEKVNNLGNYENERVSIEIAVGEGESAQAAMDAAKAFVERNLTDPNREHEIRQARRVVANPDDFPPKQLREAQVLLAAVDGDLPF